MVAHGAPRRVYLLKRNRISSHHAGPPAHAHAHDNRLALSPPAPSTPLSGHGHAVPAHAYNHPVARDAPPYPYDGSLVPSPAHPHSHDYLYGPHPSEAEFHNSYTSSYTSSHNSHNSKHTQSYSHSDRYVPSSAARLPALMAPNLNNSGGGGWTTAVGGSAYPSQSHHVVSANSYYNDHLPNKFHQMYQPGGGAQRNAGALQVMYDKTRPTTAPSNALRPGVVDMLYQHTFGTTAGMGNHVASEYDKYGYGGAPQFLGGVYNQSNLGPGRNFNFGTTPTTSTSHHHYHKDVHH
eukprot:TRINITY_DN47891_c0_g1_i1.p1 TRINITY_DN47891_c0_g1~~TRINITY_DN47891_c0_g1_i1.p1  ORF type:complete len:310 (+),score=23.62 TRINITY_DN47891_c0_g1_i1:52-930(+)